MDMYEELDEAQALGLCAVAMKRPRKGRSVDEERSSSFLATPSNSSWPPCCLSQRFATTIKTTFSYAAYI